MLRRHTRIAFSGSLHFVTTVTAEHGNWFIENTICENILKVFEVYRNKYGIHCFGYVLMPDHLHAVLYQEEEGLTIPSMLQGFKSLISQKHKPIGYQNNTLWRRRYDDVPLPGSKAVSTRIDYMHWNPVRRGIVSSPEDYRWSSAREYLLNEKGIVTLSPLR